MMIGIHQSIHQISMTPKRNPQEIVKEKVNYKLMQYYKTLNQIAKRL